MSLEASARELSRDEETVPVASATPKRRRFNLDPVWQAERDQLRKIYTDRIERVTRSYERQLGHLIARQVNRLVEESNVNADDHLGLEVFSFFLSKFQGAFPVRKQIEAYRALRQEPTMPTARLWKLLDRKPSIRTVNEWRRFLAKIRPELDFPKSPTYGISRGTGGKHYGKGTVVHPYD